MMNIDGGQIIRRKFLQTGVTAAASFGLFGPRRVLGAEAAETNTHLQRPRQLKFSADMRDGLNPRRKELVAMTTTTDAAGRE